jgi:hypothetical protein
MADEVEDKVIEAPVDPVSARDEVNDAVREAITSLKGEPEEAPEAPEPDQPVEAAPERVRGPDGKFISKDAAPVQAAAPDPKLPPPESTTKPSEVQPSTAAVAAPVSWAADAKALWQNLPPAIQNAVLKREDEASKGFRQYSEQTKRYEQALTPIAQESQRRGMTTEQGIQRLMDGQRFLETQPAQAIMWLAQTHGINLAELATNPPAAQPQVRTEAAPQVIPQITALEQRLQSIEFGNNLTLTQQFAASKLHYADVEEFLPDLINEVRLANPNMSPMELLEKAYDRAVWLNPDVRSKVIAAQQAETQQAQTAKVAEKAAQASRAAVSIKGSSANSRPPARAPSEGNVYDDVRAAIHQVRAG